MKKTLFLAGLTVALAIVAILNEGCSSLGELPSGKVWYQAGVSADQTKLDWLECQEAALGGGSIRAAPGQLQPTSSPLQNTSSSVQPNAYGLGVNSDQYGRPSTYQLQNGQPVDPIFNEGVNQNVYGPGIGQDQFGRPVYNAPYGAGSTVGYYDIGQQSSGVGAQIALNPYFPD